VLKLEKESDELDVVDIIDKRMSLTKAPGRAKEKMKMWVILG
jgi:hypothetical protein